MEERDQSLKADAGKLRMELIPPLALEALAAVLTYGAEKYGARSWQDVETERYDGALLRHYAAYKKEKYSKDKESGLNHSWHMLCNAMFLVCLEAEEKAGRS